MPNSSHFRLYGLLASIAFALPLACSEEGNPKARGGKTATKDSDSSTTSGELAEIKVDSEDSALATTDSRAAEKELLNSVKVPSAAEVQSAISKDAASAAQGKTVYVDIQHLATSEIGTADLEIYRFGLVKVLNSLSLNPKIVPLNPIEPSQTVFRVELDDYTLTSSWQVVKNAKFAKDNITTVGGIDVVKGDWLVYALSRPEVYDTIMRIPQTVPQLESALKAERSEAIYVNVPHSGVTFTGRVMERIPIDIGGKAGGYYWRSYDFGLEASRIAGFKDPATLQATSATVLPLVAGEYIFSLPNGMQAYMLSGFALQTRVDAQLFVATDPRRPQDGLDHCVGGAKKCGYVINGESCMGCHKSGMKYPAKIDGIKPAGSDDKLAAFIAADEKRFKTAIEEMGYSTQGPEPILETIAKYLERSSFNDKRVQGGEFEGTTRVTAGPMFER